MGALAQAVNSGKALYVGLSNYDGPTMEKAAAILAELHVPFIINQNKYNILDRTVEKNGLKETAFKLGKGLITFCPLAQGLLTNRYLNGIPEDSRMAKGAFLKKEALTDETLQNKSTQRSCCLTRANPCRDVTCLAVEGRPGDKRHHRSELRYPTGR